jgi:hypothetical protein
MHVRQATIFAGQTVKFYRSVTGDRHLFRDLEGRHLIDVCLTIVNSDVCSLMSIE